MDIEIKKATIDDIEKGLLNIFIEGYRFHQEGREDIYENISDEMLKQDLIESFEKFSILIIVKDDNIVGYLSFRIKEKHTKKIEIDQLVITEKNRGQGLGKLLIEEVKKIGRQNKCDRIELNCWTFNANAIDMYEHIGFDRQRIIYEFKL